MAEPEFIPAESNQNKPQGTDAARNLAITVYILQALSLLLGGVLLGFVPALQVVENDLEDHHDEDPRRAQPA